MNTISILEYKWELFHKLADGEMALIRYIPSDDVLYLFEIFSYIFAYEIFLTVSKF